MASSLEEEDSAILEEREELMLPPTSAPDTHPTPRVAHFLKPSIKTPLSNLPSISLSSSTAKDPPLKVSFNGWRNPQKNWNSWVTRMHSLHKSTWLKAGIHDAIMNSTFTINRVLPLVLGFTERWCSKTNTFVFPFGESTISLEDVMILGGYSVLGESVLETTGLEEIQEKLEQARSELRRTKAHNATQSKWMSKFLGSGSEIEHAAFLVMWLSRFVFPSSSLDTIRKNVIPIASRLSKGTKVALAPAVLASIYRDLSLLKNAIVGCCTKSEDEDDRISVTVWSSFSLVQVWIWERFPEISPNPNSIDNCEPRLARWHSLNQKMTIESVRLALESASNYFRWRPYGKDINTNKEGWLSFDCHNEDLVASTRCLRASELVGLELDCIEQYLPHRTAMQFGFDQDLPGHVERANDTPKIAWRNYTRPVVDKKLYFPPQLFEANVTTRYFKWWNKNFISESTSDQMRNNDALVPPGFRPKCSNAEAGDSLDEDQQTMAEYVRNRRMGNRKETKMAAPLHSPVSSFADSEFVQKVKSSVSKKKVKSEAVVEELEKTASKATDNGGNGTSKKRQSSVFNTNDPRKIGTNLEARVSKLEKEVARLKAAMGNG